MNPEVAEDVVRFKSCAGSSDAAATSSPAAATMMAVISSKVRYALENTKSFNESSGYPGLKALKIYVDPRNESLFLPIRGVQVPFHIRCIKNINLMSSGGGMG